MRKKLLSMLLAMLCMNAAFPCVVHASEGEYVITKTFQADSKNGTYDFGKHIEVEGIKYVLKNVDYEFVSKQYKKVPGTVTHTEISEAVPAGQTPDFEAEIQLEDITYTLQEVSEKPAEAHKQKVTSYTDYEYVVAKQDVPQAKTVAVTNEKTAATESIECTFVDLKYMGTKWIASHIDMQFKDYNSTSFLWQGIHMANNPELPPLQGYEKELLVYVGLTEGNGKVLKTYWTSEVYEKDGLLYRDGKADIERNVPVYRAVYESELITEMSTYEATYSGDGMVDSDEWEYTITGTATYVLDNMSAYLLSGGLALLFIILVIVLFVILHKKSKKKATKK